MTSCSLCHYLAVLKHPALLGKSDSDAYSLFVYFGVASVSKSETFVSYAVISDYISESSAVIEPRGRDTHLGHISPSLNMCH